MEMISTSKVLISIDAAGLRDDFCIFFPEPAFLSIFYQVALFVVLFLGAIIVYG